jgi:hypothetical protein
MWNEVFVVEFPFYTTKTGENHEESETTGHRAEI